jgi:hypothetical protein
VVTPAGPVSPAPRVQSPPAVSAKKTHTVEFDDSRNEKHNDDDDDDDDELASDDSRRGSAEARAKIAKALKMRSELLRQGKMRAAAREQTGLSPVTERDFAIPVITTSSCS